MNFAPIENVIQRPAQPQEVGEIRGWNSIEEHLRVELPDDYKKFIHLFGTGSINTFLFILNPFSSNQYVNLLRRGQTEREAFLTSKAHFPKHYVDNVFPEPGGLLPFGVTDNGEVLYWRTVGRSKDWTVTVYESRGPKHFSYEGGMEAFLSCVLTGSIICTVLPRGFIKPTPKFDPIKMDQT